MLPAATADKSVLLIAATKWLSSPAPPKPIDGISIDFDTFFKKFKSYPFLVPSKWIVCIINSPIPALIKLFI